MKITVLNDISRDAIRKAFGDFEEVSLNENPEILFVRSADLKNMDLPKSLVAIGRAGSGVDNILMDWCNKNGVAVFNAPGANANAVKEMVLLSLVAAARPAIQASLAVQTSSEKPEDLKKHFKGSELEGKTILVVGLGQVGFRVAKLCRELGMSVFYHDPMLPEKSDAAQAGFVKVEGLLSHPCHWDYVTLHCSMTKDNKGFVNNEFLKRCQRGVKVLNFARGELVNEVDMTDALLSGLVSSYISDFVPADRSRYAVMTGTRRAIFFPHLGASTLEAESKAVQMVAESMKQFLDDGRCIHSVNLPEMPKEEIAEGRLRFVITNWDKPGVITAISLALKTVGLNIGTMINRSRKDSGLAHNYIDVDAAIDYRIQSAHDVIKEVPGVTRVRVVI